MQLFRDYTLFFLLRLIHAIQFLLQGLSDHSEECLNSLKKKISKALSTSCQHLFLVRRAGILFRLNPREAIANAILVDGWETDRVLPLFNKELKPGSTFVDLGANLGWFSLIAGRLCGSEGKVLAVEASPITFERLQENIKLNNLPGLMAVQAGVSDRETTLPFHYNPNNPGVSSFLYPHTECQTINVACYPLNKLLQQHGLRSIDILKVDIEGLEYRVLSQFFEEADPQRWPRIILFEHHPQNIEREGGNTIQLLLSHGYQIKYGYDHNLCMHRPNASR